ncbi:MAG: phage portal protein [Selenomonadaceae bacterium]
MEITGIEKLIAVFSPKKAMERISYRMAMDEMRGIYGGYDAADNSRLNRGRDTINSPASRVDNLSRDVLRARVRAAERNSDIIEAMITAITRNVIGGKGIRLQIRLSDGQEVLENEFDKLELLWKRWCRECDVSGTQTFREMQEMIVRRYKLDGGIFILKVYTKDSFPFKLQVIEVDELDSTYNTGKDENGNRAVNGIKYNQFNKPVKYYFVKYDANGLLTGERIEVDAKDVCFIWKKTRPSQLREITSFAPVLSKIYDINDLNLYMLTKEKVNACLAAFVKRAAPTATSFGRNAVNSAGERKEYTGKQLTPGMIMELNEGDEISSISPPNSSGGVDFMRQQQRLAGAGIGLSYETTSRDMSQVNYSSARQGLLEDWETYGDIQQTLIDHFLRWVFNEFLYCSVALLGLVNLPDFFAKRAEYEECADWIVPARKWIDPKKEIEAEILALDKNLKTYQEVITAQGNDPYQTLKDIKQFTDWKSLLGIKETEVKSSEQKTSNKPDETDEEDDV